MPSTSLSSPEHALIDERDGIITVTFNRPAKLNAISPDITDALWQAVNALAQRPDLRALVITGTGRFFSAGIDLKLGRRERVDRSATGIEYRYDYRAHHRLYDEIEQIEKPVLIAANGPCLGAGTELAVSCDFRFCTPETYFGLPEIRSASSRAVAA
jgi:enoyl-CoA hydratase/carnithine racemase